MKIVDDNEASIEEVYNRFEKLHTKIKFQSFGKSRIKGAGSIKTKAADKTNMNDDARIDMIMKERSARLEKEVKELKSYQSRPTRAFKLLEKVTGKKKSGPEAVAILDPITEELKTSRKEILDTTILYCKNLLTNNKPDVEYEKDIKIKNILHDARMKEYNEEDDTFEDNDFLEAI